MQDTLLQYFIRVSINIFSFSNLSTSFLFLSKNQKYRRLSFLIPQ